MNKATQALAIVTSNKSLSNTALVDLIKTQLGMSLAGARTYAYNARKAAGLHIAVKAKSVKKARKDTAVTDTVKAAALRTDKLQKTAGAALLAKNLLKSKAEYAAKKDTQ